MNIKKYIFFIAMFVFIPLMSFAWSGSYNIQYNGIPSANISSFCINGRVPTGSSAPVSTWGNYRQLRVYYMDTGELATKNDTNSVSGSGCLDFSSVVPGRFFGIYLSEGITWDSDNNGIYNATDPCDNLMNRQECINAIVHQMNSYYFMDSVYEPIGVFRLSSTTNIVTASIGDVPIDIFGGSISFMKTPLLSIIGSGIGTLKILMPYIIGLVIFSSIIYLLYRVFRLFKY